MLRYGLIILTASALVGCAASAEVDPQFGESDQPEQEARLAAFAANPDNQYPQNAEAQDTQVSAVVNRGSNTIKLYNYTDQPITNAKVWVNGRFVTQIDRIGSGQSVTLNRSQFYSREGTSLGRINDPINTVQLQSGDQLYNVQGPAFEGQR